MEMYLLDDLWARHHLRHATQELWVLHHVGHLRSARRSGVVWWVRMTHSVRIAEILHSVHPCERVESCQALLISRDRGEVTASVRPTYMLNVLDRVDRVAGDVQSSTHLGQPGCLCSSCGGRSGGFGGALDHMDCMLNCQLGSSSIWDKQLTWILYCEIGSSSFNTLPVSSASLSCHAVTEPPSGWDGKNRAYPSK